MYGYCHSHELLLPFTSLAMCLELKTFPILDTNTLGKIISSEKDVQLAERLFF